MAITFKDFIVECELYPYSRENFEFMKECSELSLTEKYIKDQLFLKEAMCSLSSSNINLEENFFQESADTFTIEFITEKFQVKSGSLLSRILVRCAKIYRTFARFFARITGKFDATTKLGQEVLSIINSRPLDDTKISKMKGIVNSAKNNESTAFPVRVNQPFKKNIKIKYAGSEDINDLRDDLAVALSNETVLADVTLNKDRTEIDVDKILVMDPDVIIDAAATIYAGKEAEIMNVSKKLMDNWILIRKKGLEIEANTKMINQTAEQLNKISDKIVELGNEINTAAPLMHAAAKSTVDSIKMATAQMKTAKNKNTEEEKVQESTIEEFETYDDDMLMEAKLNNANSDKNKGKNNRKSAAAVKRAKARVNNNMDNNPTSPDSTTEPTPTNAPNGSNNTDLNGKTSGIKTLVVKMGKDLKSGNVPELADLTKTINEFVSMVTGAIGGTTRIYVQLNAYRQTVVKELDEYLKTGKTNN